jgi:hypothetical protein
MLSSYMSRPLNTLLPGSYLIEIRKRETILLIDSACKELLPALPGTF